MKKRIFALVIIVIILIVVALVYLYNSKDIEENENISNKGTVIYSSDGNVIYDPSKANETTGVEENIVIQGLVSVKSDKYIILEGRQHFGEYGYEIDEYTDATINNNNQECIDYFTLEKYDTSYIEEGDMLICSGDLTRKYKESYNTFDTKDNSIIVLKSNDYEKMKQEAIEDKRAIHSTITIGDIYENYIYLEYTLEDDTNSDISYNFPFAEKVYISDDTKIIGNLQKGETVKVEYNKENGNSDALELKELDVVG